MQGQGRSVSSSRSISTLSTQSSLSKVRVRTERKMRPKMVSQMYNSSAKKQKSSQKNGKKRIKKQTRSSSILLVMGCTQILSRVSCHLVPRRSSMSPAILRRLLVISKSSSGRHEMRRRRNFRDTVSLMSLLSICSPIRIISRRLSDSSSYKKSLQVGGIFLEELLFLRSTSCERLCSDKNRSVVSVFCLAHPIATTTLSECHEELTLCILNTYNSALVCLASIVFLGDRIFLTWTCESSFSRSDLERPEWLCSFRRVVLTCCRSHIWYYLPRDCSSRIWTWWVCDYCWVHRSSLSPCTRREGESENRDDDDFFHKIEINDTSSYYTFFVEIKLFRLYAELCPFTEDTFYLYLPVI